MGVFVVARELGIVNSAKIGPNDRELVLASAKPKLAEAAEHSREAQQRYGGESVGGVHRVCLGDWIR